MLFNNRAEAGKKLAERLAGYKDHHPIILAIPRGGVPIGFEIAKKLMAPLDILVVRKLGAPYNPEFGIGAIAPSDTRVLDNSIIESSRINTSEITQIEKLARQEMERRIKTYRGTNTLPLLKGKTVIMVDDGIATGVTTRAAIKYILGQHPEKLIIAIPVCALDSAQGIRSIIRPITDEFICLSTPYDFSSVGTWYRDFSEVSDQDVIDLLKSSQKSTLKRKVINQSTSPNPRSYLHRIK